MGMVVGCSLIVPVLRVHESKLDESQRARAIVGLRSLVDEKNPPAWTAEIRLY